MVDATQAQTKKVVSESHSDLVAHIWRLPTQSVERSRLPLKKKVKQQLL